MNYQLKFLSWIVFFLVCLQVHAQTDSTQLITDELQFDLKDATVDKTTNSLVANLFVISYSKDQREFKLNTYATQVADDKGKLHFVSSIKLGNVFVRFEDRQNYLHYLFEEEKPVPMQITVQNWGKEKPTELVIVFENSEEEGQFMRVKVPFAP